MYINVRTFTTLLPFYAVTFIHDITIVRLHNICLHNSHGFGTLYFQTSKDHISIQFLFVFYTHIN